MAWSGSGPALVRRTIELDNAVAAELAGSQDAVLRTLESHLDADVFLRGNVLTLEGDEAAVEAGAAVVRELSDLIAQGHDIAPGTVEAVARALDEHESPSEILEDVVWRHRATRVAPKTVNQKRYVDSIRSNTITFGIGPAGTGKTFLAVALAAAALSRREVNRIILTRPAVEAGERLGFLPGDLMAKVDPYLRPLFDALHDMLDPERVSQHLERGVIEVAPLAFMRGRTLNDSFIILDEAQNTTPEQMKMFLTRLGFNSKMVVTGDITQVDLPREQDSGLIVVVGHPGVRRGDRVRPFRRRGRRAPQAGAADRGRLQRTHPAGRAGVARAQAGLGEAAVLDVEVIGIEAVDPDLARPTSHPPTAVELEELCALALASAGIEEGHVAIEFVDEDRSRELNLQHRQIDAPTDVLSFGVDEDGVSARPA